MLNKHFEPFFWVGSKTNCAKDSIPSLVTKNEKLSPTLVNLVQPKHLQQHHKFSQVMAYHCIVQWRPNDMVWLYIAIPCEPLVTTVLCNQCTNTCEPLATAVSIAPDVFNPN